MRDLYVIVEGETELEFMNRLLIPFLRKHIGSGNHIQALMVTMSGGGHGFNNIEHFKNTIKPVMSYNSEPFITSFIDYYGINSERKMPGYTACMKNTLKAAKVSCLENCLNDAVQAIITYRFFIPYIQLHEFETLLYADPSVGFDLESESIKEAVQQVADEFDCPEDINDTYETSPSNRLKDIYKDHGSKYAKGADAVDVAELTSIETIMNQCPRFKAWVERLIQKLKNS
jgi:hypothetical protein